MGLGPFGFIAGLLAAGLWFTLLFTMNAIQVICILFFPAKITYELSGKMAEFIWSNSISYAAKFGKVRFIFEGETSTIADRERAFVVANHRSYTDWMGLLAFARSKKMLSGVKFFVKDTLKYLPGVGFGIKIMGFIFVRRNWEKDRQRIDQAFSFLKSVTTPIWLFSFLEGTRMTSKKLAESQQFAKDRNMPVLKNVLLPRTKGFVASLQGMEGHLDAVYDMTIGYPKGQRPSLWDIACCKCDTEIRVYIRRFPVKELPTHDAAKMHDWTVQLFQEKDALLDEYYTTGKFPKSVKKTDVKPSSVPPTKKSEEVSVAPSPAASSGNVHKRKSGRISKD